jgi:Brp/Blh family beta-carotene 15,15'-monooxygenase
MLDRRPPQVAILSGLLPKRPAMVRAAEGTGVLSLAHQRSIFLVVAIVAIAASIILPRPPANAELIVPGALIVFLGVPHGALDILYIRRVLGIRLPRHFVLTLLSYLAISGVVVWLWVAAPLIFLIGFLMASGFHFSGDPERGASPFTRVATGVGVVALPVLFHAAELQHLYSLLTNRGAAETVVEISYPLAVGVVFVGALAVAIEITRRHFAIAGELAIVLLLVTVAPPLLGFTIYFCLMHSARHILRTAELVPISHRAFVIECVLPMVAVLLAGCVAWQLQAVLPMDAKVIQILFVILAALTAPHMVIVEPIRFRGWNGPDDPASDLVTG